MPIRLTYSGIRSRSFGAVWSWSGSSVGCGSEHSLSSAPCPDRSCHCSSIRQHWYRSARLEQSRACVSSRYWSHASFPWYSWVHSYSVPCPGGCGGRASDRFRGPLWRCVGRKYCRIGPASKLVTLDRFSEVQVRRDLDNGPFMSFCDWILFTVTHLVTGNDGYLRGTVAHDVKRSFADRDSGRRRRGKSGHRQKHTRQAFCGA